MMRGFSPEITKKRSFKIEQKLLQVYRHFLTKGAYTVKL